MKRSQQSRSSELFWRAEINSLELADIEEKNGQGLFSSLSTVSGVTENTPKVLPLVLFGLIVLILGYLIGRLDT